MLIGINVNCNDSKNNLANQIGSCITFFDFRVSRKIIPRELTHKFYIPHQESHLTKQIGNNQGHIRNIYSNINPLKIMSKYLTPVEYNKLQQQQNIGTIMTSSFINKTP